MQTKPLHASTNSGYKLSNLVRKIFSILILKDLVAPLFAYAAEAPLSAIMGQFNTNKIPAGPIFRMDKSRDGRNP